MAKKANTVDGVQPTKTVEQLAKEVIAGLWGNGNDRKVKLTKAGYNYTAVQNRVNQMLSGKGTTDTTPKKQETNTNTSATNKGTASSTTSGTNTTTSGTTSATTNNATNATTSTTPNTANGTTTSQTTNTTPTINYQQLIDYFKTQNETARKSAIDAITARVNAQKSAYNTQMTGLGDQYQALRNQSEVERYKTRNALREAQANSGQLGSGYGRQEQLLMDTQYGNAINSINLQEQQAKNDIKNLIQQTEAEGEADKTTVNNNYASAIQQYIAQLQKDSQQ